ncbi:MAG: aspartate kinase [Tenericutes bacterium]|jgi:aspartate kinase|nr:aspartate kinase [Mycoplasmatota bacterium]
MNILAKFGGSSLSSAKQFKKVKSIIVDNKDRKIIVVSAPGKDEKYSSKVTDLLLLLNAHIDLGIDYDQLLESIKERFMSIIDELKIESSFLDDFSTFIKQLKKGYSKDDIVSRGEYFCAEILSKYLGFEFLDAKDVIRLNFDGTINEQKTKEKLLKMINPEKRYVIPGYYASTPEHKIRTFKRGGSDLSGSIITKALEYDLYENWTDVSGLYVADPTIINHPKRIDKITYNELRELSYRGATVIQQEAIIPLEKTEIPIHIKNTNQPSDFGTLIATDIDDNGAIVSGLAGSKDYTSLTILKDSYQPLSTILIKVLSVFEKYKLSVEHIPTGIDNFNIITKTKPLKNVYFDVINDLIKIDGVMDVSTEDEVALVAIVGRNMSYIPGVSGRIFSTLGKQKINIKVIAQASKEISIIIGVKNSDYEQTIETLYHEFY